MSRWDVFFWWNNFLVVDRPQNIFSLDLKEPVTFSTPMKIQICSFGKALLLHSPVLWAAMRAFFARLSTVMMICSFREHSCHLFVSLACHCTYLYCTWNGWAERRFLKTRRISACDWLVENGRMVQSHGKQPHCYHNWPQQEGSRHVIWMLLHLVSIAS